VEASPVQTNSALAFGKEQRDRPTGSTLGSAFIPLPAQDILSARHDMSVAGVTVVLLETHFGRGSCGAGRLPSADNLRAARSKAWSTSVKVKVMNPMIINSKPVTVR
jgi:hypothetical protein